MGGGAAYPHGCEDDGKVVVTVVHHVLGLLHEAGLATDLGRNLGARREREREREKERERNTQ